MAQEKCPRCRGDGNCQACGGKGWVFTGGSPERAFANQRTECRLCGGTGKCERCGGKGYLDKE